MIPYLHKEKKFDDLVGLDDSRLGRNIKVVKRNEQGELYQLDIGYYDFHRDYRIVTFEDIALLQEEIWAYLQALKDDPRGYDEPAPNQNQQHAVLNPATLEWRTPETVIFYDDMEGVPNVIREGDIAALNVTLLGSRGVMKWKLWAEKENLKCWVEDPRYLLIMKTALSEPHWCNQP